MMNYQLYVETRDADEKGNEKFVEKRSTGAKEIAAKAAAKGGYAKPTFWHFSAKTEPYNEMLKAVKEGKPLSFFEKKYKEAHKKLHSNGFHTQKEFQMIMGVLEVYGEILIQIRNGTRY